ncbi:MAG: prepilin-type N-terminal cleavage/methylation domain-containing protein [Armatimonadetes bacterium]|nr:prepilin-type N-terminal cleavage/methylation domain-containing protein [Armatimonadota bacterium]
MNIAVRPLIGSCPVKKGAFTLIELLVVIAIIAILAAILFPVFSRAKEAAKKTRSLAQMRQLSASVMMYAGDYDDYFPPATMRSFVVSETPTIWTQILDPYVKNKEIFIPAGTDAGFATDWFSRRHQGIGYSDATGVDPYSTATPGSAGPGTEGFRSAVNFSQAEEAARTGLFAVTANGPEGDTTSKHRGYVFNPYNGMNSPDGDYLKGLPLISDRDLVVDPNDKNYPNSPNLPVRELKPIFCRYGADKQGHGTSPIVFADGHVKVFTADGLNKFGAVIWRFR